MYNACAMDSFEDSALGAAAGKASGRIIIRVFSIQFDLQAPDAYYRALGRFGRWKAVYATRSREDTTDDSTCHWSGSYRSLQSCIVI